MEDKLGWGSFSTVWRCRDQEGGKHVAVKVAKSDSTTTETVSDEICLLRSALEPEGDHPGREVVLRMVGQGEVTGPHGCHLLLVLELAGPNLLQCLDPSTGMRLSTVRLLMLQVLQGLDFIHSKAGIIHTDIKPENIMLATPGPPVNLSLTVPPGLRVKIGDFGNACWTHKKFIVAGESLGTREYRGPEVLVGAEYGPPVDVWAAACLAWELATGEYLMVLDHDTRHREEEHLACVTELLGPLPRQLVRRGKHSREFYAEDGQLRRFPTCTLRTRSLTRLLEQRFEWPEQRAQDFSRWLRPLLVLEPEDRATAGDAMRHPYLLMLEQEDVRDVEEQEVGDMEEQEVGDVEEVEEVSEEVEEVSEEVEEEASRSDLRSSSSNQRLGDPRSPGWSSRSEPSRSRSRSYGSPRGRKRQRSGAIERSLDLKPKKRKPHDVCDQRYEEALEILERVEKGVKEYKSEIDGLEVKTMNMKKNLCDLKRLSREEKLKGPIERNCDQGEIIKKLEAEVQMQKDELSDEKETITEQKTKIKELQAEVLDFKEQLNYTKKEYHELMEKSTIQLKEEKKMNKELVIEVAKLETDIETNNINYKNLKEIGEKESALSRVKLGELEEQFDNCKKEYDELKEKSDRQMIEEQKINRELVTKVAKLERVIETKSDDIDDLKEIGGTESTLNRGKLENLEAKLAKLQSSHHTEETLTEETSKCVVKQFVVENVKLERENDSLLKMSNLEKVCVEGGCVNNNVVLENIGSREETTSSDNNVDGNNGYKEVKITDQPAVVYQPGEPVRPPGAQTAQTSGPHHTSVSHLVQSIAVGFVHDYWVSIVPGAWIKRFQCTVCSSIFDHKELAVRHARCHTWLPPPPPPPALTSLAVTLVDYD